MNYKYAYANNTGSDVSIYHSIIMAAISNHGIFCDDYADIFLLTKTAEGSVCNYILSFA